MGKASLVMWEPYGNKMGSRSMRVGWEMVMINFDQKKWTNWMMDEGLNSLGRVGVMWQWELYSDDKQSTQLTILM